MVIFSSWFQVHYTTSEEPRTLHHYSASYRPISNLNIISKLLQHLYLARLVSHVTPSFCPLLNIPNSSDIFHKNKKFHSTEMTPLKIINDMFKAVDLDRITILIAIDISVAFSSISHCILLSSSFGVTRLALSCVRSYRTHLTSFIKVGSTSLPIAFCKDPYRGHYCSFFLLNHSLR